MSDFLEKCPTCGGKGYLVDNSDNTPVKIPCDNIACIGGLVLTNEGLIFAQLILKLLEEPKSVITPYEVIED